MAAEAFVLCLDKKNQKSSHLRYASFAARGHCAAKRGSATGCLDLRLWLRPHLPALHANLKGPLQPHLADKCYPAFARSWEDDENPSHPPQSGRL